MQQIQQMQLNWTMCQGNVWCKLNSVNLKHAHFNNMQGVYIIWHGGLNPAVVYIGHGNIKDRIAEHRRNPMIQKYDHLDLYVTWATVHEHYRHGVKAYLADQWRPIVDTREPQVDPIAVNSPW